MERLLTWFLICCSSTLVRGDEYCAEPYTCMSTDVCRRIHVGNKLPILFLCQLDDDYVCCPPMLETSDLTSKAGTEDIMSHRNINLIPQKGCGVSVNWPNKIIDGAPSIPGEFPWMALLMFTHEAQPDFILPRCGGSLINGRYILTAAHCFKDQDYKLAFVRLGEHDLTKEEDCSEGICFKYYDILIEGEPILHEEWDIDTVKHDIALLRLSEDVLKYEQLKPICLDVHRVIDVGDEFEFETTGWGLTNHLDKFSSSEVLLKTNLYNKNLEECKTCRKVNGGTPSFCPLTESRVCAQGHLKQDVCKGDSGGPLTTFNKLPTYQIGITSFKSTDHCGLQNVPSIFTNVTYYLPWILDHISP